MHLHFLLDLESTWPAQYKYFMTGGNTHCTQYRRIAWRAKTGQYPACYATGGRSGQGCRDLRLRGLGYLLRKLSAPAGCRMIVQVECRWTFP